MSTRLLLPTSRRGWHIAEANVALAASTPHRRAVAVAGSGAGAVLLGRQRAVGVGMQTSPVKRVAERTCDATSVANRQRAARS